MQGSRVAAGIRKGGAVDLLLAAETLLAFLYTWMYLPITQNHWGDFIAMLSHRQYNANVPVELRFWDGEGIGYGPIFALVDLALRPVGDLLAMRICYVINLALLFATVALLIRTFLPAPRSRREVLIALFLTVNSYPVFQLIRQNNIEILELAFLTFGYVAFVKDRQWRAGVFFGLAAATKLVPAVLFAVLAWRRRWRALAAALATSAGAFILVGIIKNYGPRDLMHDLTTRATLEFPLAFGANQAISGFFYRLVGQLQLGGDAEAFTHPIVLYPVFAAWATKLTVVAGALVVGVLLIRQAGFWPGPSRSLRLEVLEMQIVLLVALFGLPHAHSHYFGLVLPLYFLALRAQNESSSENGTTWIFAFSVLLAFAVPLRVLDPIMSRFIPAPTTDVYKLLSVPMASALLALIGALQLHRTWARAAQPVIRPTAQRRSPAVGTMLPAGATVGGSANANNSEL
jgi:hypothetical protein